MTAMTHSKKAALSFKQALKHEADDAKCDEWLKKACDAENKAKEAGEPLPVDLSGM